MQAIRIVSLLIVAAFVLAAEHKVKAAPPAPAPAPAPANLPLPRVAIANPSAIFVQLKEYGDLKQKLEDRRKELVAKEQQFHDEIEKMIETRNASYNPKHPQYEQATRDIDTKKAEFQVWGMTTKASVEREQKMMVKDLYDKIEAAVAQVAKQDNIDLVIADGRQDLKPGEMESLTYEELRRYLNTRAILYSNSTVDISQKVIAVLDQQYMAGGGGGNAVPPPQPGSTPPSRLPK